MGTGLLLQNSTKDAIITYINDFIKRPIIIQAVGESDIIQFDNDGEVEVANVRKTADNAMLVTIKPALVTGSITQQWQSPSRLSLAAIQNTQYAATMGIPGTLNITSPSGLWNITLPNVILKGVPSAPTMTVDGVQQVKTSFSCDIPTSLNIGAIASTAMAALNLLG